MDLPTSLTIIAAEATAPAARTLVFAPAIPYRPGQYLTLVHPHQPAVRRSYSLASVPALGEAPTIGVRRVDNGAFSRWLVDEARVGDVVPLAGVGGLFTLPAELAAVEQVFFFAAGSGIVPVLGLLKEVLHFHPALHAVLVYSNHSAGHAMYLDAVRELAEAFAGRFVLELLFSTDPNLNRAHLHRDLLETLVRQHAAAPPAALLAYTCGPLNYMRTCLYGLRELGVPADQIRRENFDPRPVTAPARPPDTDEHRVTIESPTGTITFPVQYPATILRAARAAGLQLPYSCEGGVCGQCVRRCVRGRVWMSYNEVLTDADAANGLVLTCVGYPVGGDVTLAL